MFMGAGFATLYPGARHGNSGSCSLFHVVASQLAWLCHGLFSAGTEFGEDTSVEIVTSGILLASSVWVLLCGWKAHLGSGYGACVRIRPG